MNSPRGFKLLLWLILCSLLMYFYIYASPGYKEAKLSTSASDYKCTRPLPNIYGNREFLIKNPIYGFMPSRMLINNYPAQKYPSCGDKIFPNRLLNNGHNWLLIMIKSAPKNLEKRNVIRSTWGGIRAVNGEKVFVIFVIGISSDKNANDLLYGENQLYGDLLQCNFVDSYNGLPIKVIAMLGWLLSSKIQYDFLEVNDDDVSLRIDVIYDYFKKRPELINSEKFVCGFMLSKKEVPSRSTKDSNSKWYTSLEAYSGSKYPWYCNGPSYAMTKPMVEAIYCVAIVTNFTGFYWEDILVTGVFREKLGELNQGNIEMGSPMLIDSHTEKAGAILRMKHAWKRWNAQASFKFFLKHNATFLPYGNKLYRT